MGGGLRAFLPSALPAHETVYAMTVHKSQGSEFDSVTLVLPGVDLPVLTRELFYTGLTRAKGRLAVYADKEIFGRTLARRVKRNSGLAGRLYLGFKRTTQDLTPSGGKITTHNS